MFVKIQPANERRLGAPLGQLPNSGNNSQTSALSTQYVNQSSNPFLLVRQSETENQYQILVTTELPLPYV